MDPVTTLTFGSSSLVPWPNELSLVPDARSSPRTRLGAFTQSVLPGVVTARLPSLPSKVLPDRFADAAPASPRVTTANTAIGITIVLIETRRRARCLDMDELPEWAVLKSRANQPDGIYSRITAIMTSSGRNTIARRSRRVCSVPRSARTKCRDGRENIRNTIELPKSGRGARKNIPQPLRAQPCPHLAAPVRRISQATEAAQPSLGSAARQLPPEHAQ